MLTIWIVRKSPLHIMLEHCWYGAIRLPQHDGHRRPSPTWWRHQMEIFSALLAICAGNSPVPGEFPTQRPVTRSFDVFFYLRLNKRLSKQSWGWWLETLSRPLWRHCNENGNYCHADFIVTTKSHVSSCIVVIKQSVFKWGWEVGKPWVLLFLFF